jgi:hypothetical protein
MQQPVRHAAERYERYVGAAAGAENEDPRVILVDDGEDPPGQVAVIRLMDASIGVNAGILQVGDNVGDEVLTVSLVAVHLEASESMADSWTCRTMRRSPVSWASSRVISTAAATLRAGRSLATSTARTRATHGISLMMSYRPLTGTGEAENNGENRDVVGTKVRRRRPG